jgi:hypothetical protein
MLLVIQSLQVMAALEAAIQAKEAQARKSGWPGQARP